MRPRTRGGPWWGDAVSRWRQAQGRRRRGVGLILLLLAALSGGPRAAADEAQQELLAGVRAFRGGRYPEALITFRRLSAQGAVPEIGFYLGTTLHKLGLHAEALSAFRSAHAAGLREPVGDYYAAVSCFRLGMLERARAGFSALLSSQGEEEAGPRLREGANRFLQAINDAPQPPAARYEAALLQAAQDDPEGREWLEEALRLSRRVPPELRQVARLQRLVQRSATAEPPPALQVGIALYDPQAAPAPDLAALWRCLVSAAPPALLGPIKEKPCSFAP